MLDNPEITKLLIYALAGLCAVLALALLIVSVHKNTYYVDEEGNEVPPVRKKKQKEVVEEAEEDEDDVIIAAPVAVDEKPIHLDLDEPTEEKEPEIPSFTEPMRHAKLSGISKVELTVVINGHSTPANITNFPCAIGRESANDLVVSESAVSRKHARFFVENGRLMIEDISGHNGVYVNQKKVESLGSLAVNEGDIIRLGRAEIRVDQIA